MKRFRNFNQPGLLQRGIARTDWQSAGRQNPISADGMFTKHLDHPAFAVTDPAGHIVSRQDGHGSALGGNRRTDPIAEVLLLGKGKRLPPF